MFFLNIESKNECLFAHFSYLLFYKNKNEIIIVEILEVEFLFRMMASRTSMTKPGWKACLDIIFDLKTDHVEDEDNAKAAPK